MAMRKRTVRDELGRFNFFIDFIVFHIWKSPDRFWKSSNIMLTCSLFLKLYPDTSIGGS